MIFKVYVCNINKLYGWYNVIFEEKILTMSCVCKYATRILLQHPISHNYISLHFLYSAIRIFHGLREKNTNKKTSMLNWPKSIPLDLTQIQICHKTLGNIKICKMEIKLYLRIIFCYEKHCVNIGTLYEIFN